MLRGYFPRLGTLAFQLIERVLARRTDALVAVSPQVRDDLVELEVAPPQRFAVVRLGIDLGARTTTDADPKELRRRLGIGPKRFVIGWFGRMTAVKRTDDLVDVLVAVRKLGIDACLLLVGDGADRASLEERTRELGLTGDVRFVGWTEDPTPYLRASDVYVLPSHVEGRSTALLEALALGMPALASDIEANRGLVPEDLLPLTPVGDEAALACSIASRLRDASSWDGAGRRCREIVLREHSIERAARGHVAAFRAAGAAA